MRHIRHIGLLLPVLLCLLWPQPAAAAGREDQAQQLLDQLLHALRLPDEQQSIRALLPLLHPSLHNATHTDLSATVRGFSFQKARRTAHLYALPAQIVRTRTYDQDGIDIGNGRETGQLVDYFIRKSTGMPAPVKIFFPQTGHAVITYIGNL